MLILQKFQNSISETQCPLHMPLFTKMTKGYEKSAVIAQLVAVSEVKLSQKASKFQYQII